MVGPHSQRSFEGARCLVTGANGFIGRALVPRLLALGATVTGFGRCIPTANLPHGMTWSHGAFEDPLALVRACEGQDYVFHLLNSSTPESATLQPAADVAANVIPSIHLLEACRQVAVKQVVFASSGGTVYGMARTIPTPETARVAPISAYGVSKATIENYLSLYGHIHGLDYRVLRISNPFGPEQSPHKKQGVIAAFLYAALNNETIEIWGDGEVVRDYIFIDDVINGVLAASLYDGADKVFNIGSGRGRSLREICQSISEILNNPSLPILYKPGRKLDVPVNILDCSLLRQRTGWQPQTEWVEGLRQTMNWMKAST